METFQKLIPEVPTVNPSLLAADFGNIEREIKRLEEGGAKVLHLDIMDGHFVPNISIGVPIVESIRKITQLPLDVHLMLDNPERFIGPFRKAGADFLTIHIEVHPDPRSILDEIRRLGAVPGLAINPPTPPEKLLPYLDYCSIVLSMSVMPGFGGQKFDQTVLEKVRLFRQNSKTPMLLSIDGGVNEETIASCAAAGANLFVAGTAVFKADDYGTQMKKLLSLAFDRGLGP